VQMQQMKKLGSMKKMLGMMPGMGQMREQLENFDEREVDRVQALIQSMTPAERDNPKLINGSRRARIARGSGQTTTAVNQLLERFTQAQKMMRQMSKGGGMPGMPGGMPGIPGMPGGGGKKSRGKQASVQKKKGKSGNPAKRAQQEREAMQRALGGGPAAKPSAPGSAPGSAFGMGGGAEPDEQDLSKLQLPDGFDKLLGGR